MDGSELAARRVGVPAITRPHESLMTYYVLASLLAGPFFPFVLLPLAEAVELLAAATAELRAIREALERRGGAARDV